MCLFVVNVQWEWRNRGKHLLILFQFPEFPSKNFYQTFYQICTSSWCIICIPVCNRVLSEYTGPFDRFHNIHYSSFIIYGRASLMSVCCFQTLRRFVEISLSWAPRSVNHHIRKSPWNLKQALVIFSNFPSAAAGFHNDTAENEPSTALFSITDITSFTPLIKWSIPCNRTVSLKSTSAKQAQLHCVCIQAVQSRRFCSSQMICWI